MPKDPMMPNRDAQAREKRINQIRHDTQRTKSINRGLQHQNTMLSEILHGPMGEVFISEFVNVMTPRIAAKYLEHMESAMAKGGRLPIPYGGRRDKVMKQYSDDLGRAMALNLMDLIYPKISLSTEPAQRHDRIHHVEMKHYFYIEHLEFSMSQTIDMRSIEEAKFRGHP